jgi:hypothetical protein
MAAQIALDEAGKPIDRDENGVERDESGDVVERDEHGKKISLVEKQVEALGHTWALDHATNSAEPMLKEYFAELKKPRPTESRYNTMAPPPSGQALFDAVQLRSRAANKLAYMQLVKLRDGSYPGGGNGIEAGSALRRSLKLCDAMLGEKPQTASTIEHLAWLHVEAAQGVEAALRAGLPPGVLDVLVAPPKAPPELPGSPGAAGAGVAGAAGAADGGHLYSGAHYMVFI